MPYINKLIILTAALLALWAPPAAATERLAVLELSGEAATDDFRLHLTDSFRAGALNVIVAADLEDPLQVLTRQGMYSVLLDHNVDIARVDHGQSVETARQLGALYVISGGFHNTGDHLVLTLQLEDSQTGQLLASENHHVELGMADLLNRGPMLAASLLVNGLGLPPISGMPGYQGSFGAISDVQVTARDEVAMLRVETNPQGAVVLMDNSTLCESTPCTREVALGPHTLSLHLPRYHTSQGQLNLSGDHTFQRELSPTFGTVTITTVPAGLPVTVNNQPLGISPQTVELPAGTFDISTSDDCHALTGERIVIGEGDTRQVLLTPPGREAALELRTTDGSGDDIRASVYADNVAVGRSPGRMVLPLCVDQLWVESADGSGWTGRLPFVEGQLLERAVELVPGLTRSSNPTVITWVEVAGGQFEMGSAEGEADERPVHRVSVAPFEISTTEVTVGQYRLCVEAGACRAPTGGTYQVGLDDLPVNYVRWGDAVAYTEWSGTRLPTEAEWEYAARAGGGAVFGEGEEAGVVGWYRANSGGGPHPVRSLPSNDLGLYDMAGNVWEWTSDWYSSSSYRESGAMNSRGSQSGSKRVVRGGSWRSLEENVRVSNRYSYLPMRRSQDIGFRVCRAAQ